jgi:hypothetical protein
MPAGTFWNNTGIKDKYICTVFSTYRTDFSYAMTEDLTINTILKLKVIKILTNLIQITNPRGNVTDTTYMLYLGLSMT